MVFEWDGNVGLEATHGGKTVMLALSKGPGGMGALQCEFPRTNLPVFSWLAEHGVRVRVEYILSRQQHRFYMYVAMTEKLEDHWYAAWALDDVHLSSKGGKVRFTFGAGVLP